MVLQMVFFCRIVIHQHAKGRDIPNGLHISEVSGHPLRKHPDSITAHPDTLSDNKNFCYPLIKLKPIKGGNR
jgi:hypothetical protein